MQIGVLETGRPPEEFAGQYGSYPDMFERLLRSADSALTFKSFAALDGVLPERPDVCDAWLITGSKFGVYENHDWIGALMAFVRRAFDAGVPIAGICFGHQILAEALGGRVEKSDKGWGVGRHGYDIVRRPEWMTVGSSQFTIQAFHQDQIVTLPGGAEVLAQSEFCPYAMVAYGDKAMSLQGHPEFDERYAVDLLRTRRGTVVPVDVVDAALETVSGPQDSDIAAQWIVGFLQHAVARNRTVGAHE